MNEQLVDIFLQWNSGAGGVAVAMAALSAVMTGLKSKQFASWFGADNSLWTHVPESIRSFVPLVLGGVIGAVEVWVTGAGDVINGFASGFLMIGGAQTVLYQSTKNTPLGRVLVSLLSTYHEKAELTAAKAAAKPKPKTRKK